MKTIRTFLENDGEYSVSTVKKQKKVSYNVYRSDFATFAHS